MYAIVEIAGRQYRVEENKYLIVNRITANEGENLTFDKSPPLKVRLSLQL